MVWMPREGKAKVCVDSEIAERVMEHQDGHSLSIKE